MLQGLRFAPLALILLALPLAAQSAGSITGTITGPNNKPLGKAMVVAFNLSTFHTYDTETNGKGVYELNNLPAGSYEISVSAEGFEDFDSDSLEVTPGEPARLDAKLKRAKDDS